MAKRPTRILVVDDEPKICQLLETLLRRDGHEVAICHNGGDALARLQTGTYSLVLTDLKMPQMDGFELVRRIRELDAEIPIVVITGYATIETAVQALRHGVADYVTKPFNIEELRKAVSRTLAQAQLADENRNLMERLAKLEAELQYHRGLLQSRARLADNELRQANAELRQRVRELSVYEDLELATGPLLEAEAVSRAAVAVVGRRLGAQRVSVMLREGTDLVVRACDEARRSRILGARQRIGEGISGVVARDERAIHVADIAAHGEFAPLARGGYETASFLSVPVRHRHQVHGVINAADRRDHEPFTTVDLELLCGVATHLGGILTRAARVRELHARALNAIAEIATSLEAKDAYMAGHSQRVAAGASALAQELALSASEAAMVVAAARVHDLGKYQIPDDILHKRGQLTAPEYAQVQDHPVVSERLVESVGPPGALTRAVRHHHERVDGQGYPDSLRGEEIPLLARIISIADAFDAMTHERPYRPALSVGRACEELRALSGRQFDAELAAAFCARVAPKLATQTPRADA